MLSDMDKSVKLRRAGLIMCLIIAALGAAVLFGWYLNIQILKSIFPSLVSMKPNEAVEFILCSITLVLLFRGELGNLSRVWATILSIMIILLASATLIEHLFVLNLGIDSLLFRELHSEVDFTSAGRMSPSSAYCFLLIGIALLVGSRNILARMRLPIMAALSTTVLIISGLVLLGYSLIFLFNISLWGDSEMAVHLALGIFFIGIMLQLLIFSEFNFRWELDKIITSMFIIGMIVLLGAAAGSNHLTNVLTKDTGWVTHSQEALKDINEILTNLAILENGQRGYIISGDDKLLVHNIQIKSDLQTKVVELQGLTVDNFEQQKKIEELIPLVKRKIDFGDQMMDARKNQGFIKAQQMMANPEEIIITDKIYSLLTEIQNVEFDLLAFRIEQVKASTAQTLLILPVQVFLSLTIFSFALFWLNVGVSSRKIIENQLRQSQKMEAVGQLTGGVAHDFNNLLGVIIGNLDLLERLVVGNDIAIKRVETIQKAALRGSDLTKRLLTFSRQRQLNPALTSLSVAIKNMIEMASRVLGPDIKITTNIQESLPLILVDAAELENALLNLTVNARDAMPNGGLITISTRLEDISPHDSQVEFKDLKAGRYARIIISDSGNGMSKETLAKAFDPFFTTKPRGKGTGLGLSMVYGFVKQSGGMINIYSEVGHGTTISIYLPLADSKALAAKKTNITHEESKMGGTVLLVDDELDLLEVGKSFLEEMGYKVITAANGPSAVTILERENIDLLVTDIVMPGGMNGVELGLQARKLKPNLKIIYSSGFPSDALAERSGTQIDGPLLNKPYQRKDLIEAIRIVMGGDVDE